MKKMEAQSVETQAVAEPEMKRDEGRRAAKIKLKTGVIAGPALESPPQNL
jgi:hypothetical protein